MDFIIGCNHNSSPRTGKKKWYILLAKHKICIWIIKKQTNFLPPWYLQSNLKNIKQWLDK